MAKPASPKSRRSPILDYSDASESLHPGFGEAPQAAFEGQPLDGPVSGWADQIAQDMEVEAEKAAAKKTVKAETKPKAKKAEGAGKTARGTSMGVASDPKSRARAGLNPVAGMNVSLEDASALPQSGVTATVEALSALIESGNPLFKNGEMWLPHRPARPEKSEGGIAFKVESEFEPAGDQPVAIADLVSGISREHDQTQVLLGVTGSGKTFTVAKVIEETQRPALILAPNKTLAAQLYGEFKNFFPDNAVEYFVSYYDYYQPEAYVPRSDTFIEKESSINEQIDRMRHAATRALLERDDVIIVASVSCIYGIGSVETYTAMTFAMTVGDRLDQRRLLADLVAQQYKRRDMDFVRGSFRVRGDTIEIFPAHLEDRAWRISMFGDEIEAIQEFDPLSGKKTDDLRSVKIYANSHYVTPRPTLQQAVKSIKEELRLRLAELEKAGRLLEAQRLEQRVTFDIEMIEATGSCNGIENYSRYLTGRQPGHPPPTLFEYLPDNALVFIDESHVTIPQIGAMYRGDFRRKATLAEYGFRLPSCMDNRPLRFEEWNAMRPQTVAVSATPGPWELGQSGGVFAEQVIRPTGLTDPPVEVRPARSQVDDLLGEIRETVAKGYRVLCTVLTKRMAEDLTEYLHEQGIRVRYMHSDIDTLERIEIIRDLRLGAFDVLVGINLLREGLDIPECGLVAILDADKEGFLRSETSLIQTIGRAARNVDGKVILYADRITGSMERAMAETDRRRDKQEAYNTANDITPQSVKARIADILDSYYEKDHVRVDTKGFAEEGALVGANMRSHLDHLEKEMRTAAADLDFERAARLRDEIKRFQATELAIGSDPMARERDVAMFVDDENRSGKRLGSPSSEASNAGILNDGPAGSAGRPARTSGGKAPRARSSGPNRQNPRFGPHGEPLAARLKPDETDGTSGRDAPSFLLRADKAAPPKRAPSPASPYAETTPARTPSKDLPSPESRTPSKRPSSPESGTQSKRLSSPESGEDAGRQVRETPAPSYFQKPSLDDMGPGTDTPTPRRSPAARPGDAPQGNPAGPSATGPSLFRKNTLDEMTVRRTEKPSGSDDPRPLRRERIGLGSHEDPGDEKRRKRRPGKTGRPGR